jgi:hypothetical protein
MKMNRSNPHLENLEMFVPVVPKPARSLYEHWGHQAILTYLMGKVAMKRVHPIVTRTFLPILKLCSDSRTDVEDAFRRIQELNEKVSFFDSPYERYRKMYGNYVREVEWCCVQLRRYFTKRAYEDFIIDTTYKYNTEVMGNYAGLLDTLMLMGRTRESVRKKSGKIAAYINGVLPRFLDFIFKHVWNPVFWMVGDVEFQEYNLRTGEMVLYAKDCLMLRASRMKQLPEEICLLV